MCPRWQRYIKRYHEQYLRSSKTLIYGRLVLALLFLLSLTLSTGGFPVLTLPVTITLAMLLLVTVSYLFALRSVKDLESFVLIQLVIEVICETVLIYLTGGVFHIVFTLFYFMSIVTAAYLISRRAAILCASLCSVALASNAVAYFLAFQGYCELPFVSEGMLDIVTRRWNSVVSNLIQISVAMHIVAYLSGYLPHRVTGRRILYEEILNQIHEGVVAIDNSGRLVYVNGEARRLFNWEGVPQLIGKRFPDVLRRDEDRLILEVMTAGDDIHGEIEISVRKAPPLPIEVKITVLHDSRGFVRGVVGLFSDLTLKRKMRYTETRLQRLRGLEEMALGIAHEIRNPLASIRGAMQELSRRAFKDEDDRLLASIVLKESDRLDTILDSFMGYARMKPITLVSTDLLKIAKEIVLLLKCRDDAERVEISLESPHETLIMLLDVDKIKQVLINLGVNALQALVGKDGHLRFEVNEGTIHKKTTGANSQVYEEQESVEIAIQDNGPGIEPAIQNKLFTPFFSTKSQGTGLGLALAQKIIDAHGGDVSFESLEAGGTRFSVKIPLKRQFD
jgi:two-component system, NtrC family, sensor histidine kinase PilS